MRLQHFGALALAAVAAASPLLSPDARDTTNGVLERADGSSALQDIVTWDEYSFKIHGEHMFLYSGEFHPWRIPSPSLWLDILQKVKAGGFNTISIYMNWSLVEGTKGTVLFDGIFSFDAFFEAAKQVGLYVLVRPGPYINSELSAGGLPGWRFNSPEGINWRINNPRFFEETELYMKTVGEIIEPHQITKNGSVIMVQLDNELSSPSVEGTDFPPVDFFTFLQDQLRGAGVVVPTFHNDVSHGGIWSDTPVPDIYAYDNYPLSCGQLQADLGQDDWNKHLEFAPDEPHFVAEYTNGFYDQPGGVGYDTFDQCQAQLDPGITRIYYQNLYSMSVTALSLYMTYGGTNWGHMHWDKVYTSYDFRASISEDRTISREKYAEIKLQAQFLHVSPAFYTSRLVSFASSDPSGNPDVVVTETKDDMSNTRFWTARHSDVTNTENVTYSLSVVTSSGEVTIPQLGGELSLTGYDSKMHLTDYEIGDRSISYSSADVLSWRKFGSKTVVLVYGRTGETHETAVVAKTSGQGDCVVHQGSINACENKGDTIVVNYNTVGQSVIEIDEDILLYTLDRNEAYTFWFPDLRPNNEYPSPSLDAVMVKGPYLVRSASVSGDTISLSGDLNATVAYEVVAAPAVSKVLWNGNIVESTRTQHGTLEGSLEFVAPEVPLPDLTKLEWKSHNSLVEILEDYDDSEWIEADNRTTVNGARNLTTPTDLYAGTYGYHAGNFLYRGSFTSSGGEDAIELEVHGGKASAFSLWLDSESLGGNAGSTDNGPVTKSFTFPKPLVKGDKHIITLIGENKGYNENESGGVTFPRGIFNYQLSNAASSTIDWKITGNLGGEHYVDKVRGPHNEGGFYAERMGWHLPSPPSSDWATKSPLDGVSTPGVEIFTSSFDLDLTDDYDLPLYIDIEGSSNIRVHLFINGYKFGVYTENIGPQTRFPVPKGVMNHKGSNSIALIHWNPTNTGGKLDKLSLGNTIQVSWAYPEIKQVEQPAYSPRTNAF